MSEVCPPWQERQALAVWGGNRRRPATVTTFSNAERRQPGGNFTLTPSDCDAPGRIICTVRARENFLLNYRFP